MERKQAKTDSRKKLGFKPKRVQGRFWSAVHLVKSTWSPQNTVLPPFFSLLTGVRCPLDVCQQRCPIGSRIIIFIHQFIEPPCECLSRELLSLDRPMEIDICRMERIFSFNFSEPSFYTFHTYIISSIFLTIPNSPNFSVYSSRVQSRTIPPVLYAHHLSLSACAVPAP